MNQLIKKVLRVLILGGLTLLGIGVVVFLVLSKDLPSYEQIANRQIPESTKIFDRTGEILLYEISNGQKRTAIPLTEIPENLRDATIAIENSNFYNESAFSVRGIIRATLANITKGSLVQGASTITQQLAKNAFLSSEKTFTRKIKELILAIRIDRQYSKDQILELYLNEIPYGPTLYGVESASQAFFRKSAKDLTLAESAILAALSKAPSFYSPWGSHQEKLLQRQKLVLKKMLELQKITDEEYQQATTEEIAFAQQDTTGIKAPHFVIYVQEYLVEKYGEELVQTGGLKVITTLDWEMQQIAERAVAEGAHRNEDLYQGKNAALIAQDPKTGQVLAMVGSRNYFDPEIDGNFNVATQGLRQPGSALKPFVYLEAMKKGYAPQTVIFDVATEFDTSGNPQKSYRPENFDGIFRGPVSLRQALSQSINIPAIKTLYLVGIQNVLETVKSFGITTLNDPKRYGLSLVLGGGEVKLSNMIEAYSVLAQDGIRNPQTPILEIRDNHENILESYKDNPLKIFDPQSVKLINDILSDVESRSGLYTSSLGLTMVPGYDIALKTGTSNDYRDAWVFGYTPNFVAGVWAGNNDNSPMKKRGSSILAALPIWHAFVSEAIQSLDPEPFARPDAVLPQKPILAGDYSSGNQIHSILFYVDKNNPTGPYPANPGKDPQFENWESAVLTWAAANIPNFFTQFNQPGAPLPAFGDASSLASSQTITFNNPSVGEFINSPLSVQASLKSQNPIAEISLYLNGSLIQSFQGNFGNEYLFSWNFSSNLLPQNSLEIEIKDQKNLTTRKEVIFYH